MIKRETLCQMGEDDTHASTNVGEKQMVRGKRQETATSRDEYVAVGFAVVISIPEPYHPWIFHCHSIVEM